ncbi:MAG: VOC family protein [Oscillatoriophycideae cyanobacterium NC_groundwater_1537_Pr4_S-0.65um_50_18]|nr:VOC family protein [Oscillatoriophycideae cyanobacterium NC_groundwater_1537_Pr4_S-0.65um_50_18]
MTNAISRFHLAFPVADLAQTRSFYCSVLGCAVGRTSDRWIDFDFFGHQITAHLKPELCASSLSDPSDPSATNPVDGDAVPVRHFGIILDWQTWHQLVDRLKDRALPFVISPHIRFVGEVGEQATLFIQDPSGNALEFKSFRDESRIFAN